MKVYILQQSEYSGIWFLNVRDRVLEDEPENTFYSLAAALLERNRRNEAVRAVKELKRKAGQTE